MSDFPPTTQVGKRLWDLSLAAERVSNASRNLSANIEHLDNAEYRSWLLDLITEAEREVGLVRREFTMIEGPEPADGEPPVEAPKE